MEQKFKKLQCMTDLTSVLVPRYYKTAQMPRFIKKLERVSQVDIDYSKQEVDQSVFLEALV